MQFKYLRLSPIQKILQIAHTTVRHTIKIFAKKNFKRGKLLIKQINFEDFINLTNNYNKEIKFLIFSTKYFNSMIQIKITV
jgi:hypothetical protein